MKNQPKTLGEVFLEIIRIQKAVDKALRTQKPFRSANNGRVELHYCAN
jgi:hypothetical protein